MEDRRAVWSGLIAEQKTSGISVAAWCKERNVSYNSFCNWRTRLNKQAAADGGWVSVAIGASGPSAKPITLRIGAVTIDLSAGFDPKLLRDVVSALETQC
jgi:hypothetical protein